MKIYREIIWEWDDTRQELVEISSNSFEYEGPLLLQMDPATALMLTSLIFQGIGLYGQITGTQQEAKTKAKLGHTRATNVLNANKKQNSILTSNSQREIYAISNKTSFDAEQMEKEVEKATASHIAHYSGAKKRVEGIVTQTTHNAMAQYMDGMLAVQMIRYNGDLAIRNIMQNTKDQIEINDTYANDAAEEYRLGAEGIREAGHLKSWAQGLQGAGNIAMDASELYRYKPKTVTDNGGGAGRRSGRQAGQQQRG